MDVPDILWLITVNCTNSALRVLSCTPSWPTIREFAKSESWWYARVQRLILCGLGVIAVWDGGHEPVWKDVYCILRPKLCNDITLVLDVVGEAEERMTMEAIQPDEMDESGVAGLKSDLYLIFDSDHSPVLSLEINDSLIVREPIVQFSLDTSYLTRDMALQLAKISHIAGDLSLAVCLTRR